MRTRNSGNPKPAPPPKKTPPSRRSAGKTPPKPQPETDVSSSVHVEDANLSADDVEVTPETKATRGGKTRSSTRKTAARTKAPTSTRASSRRTPKSNATKEIEVEETPEKDEVEDHKDEESVQKEETSQNVAEESMNEAEPEKEEVGDHIGESCKKEETSETIAEESKTEVEAGIENVEVTDKGSQGVLNIKEPSIVEVMTGDMEQPMTTDDVKSSGQEEGALETKEEENAIDHVPEEEQPRATDVGKSSGQEEGVLKTKEEENAIDPEPEENPEEDVVTDDQQQKEKNTHIEELLVTNAGKSSGHEDDAFVTKGEENAVDPEPEEDPEEDDENIDQQEEKTIDTKEPLNQSVIDVEAKTLEKKELMKTVEDTIGSEQPLDQIGMNIEEPSKIEEKILEKEGPLKTIDGTIDIEPPLYQNAMDIEEPSEVEEKTSGKEENLAETVTNLEEPLKTNEDAVVTEQSLVSVDVESTSQEESQELGTEKNEEVVKEEEPVDEMKSFVEKVGPDNEPINMETDVMEEDVNQLSKEKDPQVGDESSKKVKNEEVESTSQELGTEKNEVVKEEPVEEIKSFVENVGPDNEPINMETDVMEEDVNQLSKEKDPQVGDESSKKVKEFGGKAAVEELNEGKDDVQEHIDATHSLEVERAELNAAAKERKLRKELEIFVGGLDHDVTEEDLKKAFENIGGVVQVRLLKDSSNKNKGYAFVEFTTKELASQALLEMKTPLVRGKQCRAAPSEDNDMLFLGNICNTWTKEAVKQKLEDYGIESVENINVVPDARHEGLSRGFAFLEFSCHADAMQAYKRLQKPDVIFGHTERTAKVAFAEPIREPDPEVMAHVKTVFVDGLPLQWTEDKVREKMKGYGEIIRISLSRNMSTAKRKDYGFVDFTTHEAAVACIEGINSENFGEGNSKRKVRARLSNPLPKAQPVKGGMCGGFRIGHGGGATSSSRPGRGFGLGGNTFNRQNVQHDRGFYQHGRGQTGRVGFTRDHDVHMQYPPFQRREMFGRGAWRDHFVAPHDPFSGGPTSLRPPPVDMRRHDVASDRGRGRHIPNSRFPFPPEEGYSRPVMRRQMDDPYFYDGRPHGIKRPFSMTDHEPDYMDRSRLRPRIDYSDPAVPYRAPGYRDTFGPDRNLRPHDYYGPDYREGPSRPTFYGNERPYGRGYPPRY